MKRSVTFLLVIVLLLGLLAGCGGKSDPTQNRGDSPSQPQEEVSTLTPLTPQQMLQPAVNRGSETPERKFTLMIYMVGSDLESRSGAASRDLMEMLDSGLNTTDINILVYTGGTKSWQLDIPSNCNAIYRLNSAGGSFDMVGATQEPVNTGDPATVVDFLDFSRTNYPAESYGLVFWDHGGGPLYGFGSDELFTSSNGGRESLSIWELEAAMENAALQQKLAFVGFDACLMGSIEVADVFDEYADYLIASQELEPGAGWDYSFLEIFNRTTDPEAVADKVLSTYEASMKTNPWKPEYTLSCLELSQVTAVKSELDALFTELDAGIAKGDYNAIAKARSQTKVFALSAVGGQEDSYDLVDLHDMVQKLPDTYRSAGKKLTAALDKLVMDSVTNIPQANGVTMYYPYSNKRVYEQAENAVLSLASDSQRTFLKSYSARWLGKEPAENTELDLQEDSAYFTVQLTQEQIDAMEGAYYTVLAYQGESYGMLDVETSYIPQLINIRVEPEADGTLRIPADPEIFVVRTDLGEAYSPCIMVENEVTATTRSYVSLGAYLYAASSINDGSQEIQIALQEDVKSGEVEIQTIYGRESQSDTFGKTQADLKNWTYLALYQPYRYPTFDETGWLMPFADWEAPSWQSINLFGYEEGFQFDKQPISQIDGAYACYIALKDTSGNTFATALIDFPNQTAPTFVQEGDMVFRLLEDHAVLVSYEGEAAQVTVPETVQGKPVTEIGDEAFYYNKTLTQVTLPASLTHIGAKAFGNCELLTEVQLPESLVFIGNGAFLSSGLTAIRLPDGLEMISASAFQYTDIAQLSIPASVTTLEPGAFSGCKQLTAITVDSGNSSYKSADGVVFTIDGKKLVQFPAGRTGAYAIPAGTECIEEKAFTGAKELTQVQFPEGLRRIQPYAFYEVMCLQQLQFPESLEYLGAQAFGGWRWDEVGATSVYLGKNLRWFHSSALSGYLLEEIQVSPENPNYTTVNGMLCNKAGNTLYLVPSAVSGTLEIPQGINNITNGALSEAENVTELILADSVVSVDSSLPKLEKLTIGASLRYLRYLFNLTETELTVSPNSVAFSMRDGNLYNREGTELILWLVETDVMNIPDGVKAIDWDAIPYNSLSSSTPVVKVVLPASLATFDPGIFNNLNALTAYEVTAGSTTIAAHDGLLYSADGKTLLSVPKGLSDTITVREGTVEIGADALYMLQNATKVVIPEGVTIMRSGNLSYIENPVDVYLPASLTDINREVFRKSVENVTVYCPAGSAAEAFAKELGIKVVTQ